MMIHKMKTLPEAELANRWPISRVSGCLKSGSRDELIEFLERRYEERFLQAHSNLKDV